MHIRHVATVLTHLLTCQPSKSGRSEPVAQLSEEVKQQELVISELVRPWVRQCVYADSYAYRWCRPGRVPTGIARAAGTKHYQYEPRDAAAEEAEVTTS